MISKKELIAELRQMGIEVKNGKVKKSDIKAALAAVEKCSCENCECEKCKEKAAAAWKAFPKGWTKESAKKFWDSLVGDKVHKRTACMKRMGDKIDNPGAFCNSLYDMFEK